MNWQVIIGILAIVAWIVAPAFFPPMNLSPPTPEERARLPFLPDDSTH